MNETKLPDVKLVGNAASSGGRFNRVSITGEAVLSGHTSCRSLKCTGTTLIKGDLQAESIRLTGETKVEGALRCGKLQGTGEVRAKEGLRGEQLSLTGMLDVEGGCEAEKLQVRGGLAVTGLLSAEKLEIRLLGPSTAEEIGGGTVSVKKSKAAMFKTMFRTDRPVKLTAGVIEGDVIELEHTAAGIVRGNRVVVGAGCEIGRVEYRHALDVAGSSTVRERVRI